MNQREIPLWIFAAVAVLVVIRVAAALFLKSESPDLVRWVPIARAELRAKGSGRLIMYDFSAAWCGPCRLMDDEVFRDERSAEQINQMLVPVRVVDRLQEDGRNTPEVAVLQQRYNVRAFPTIVVADSSGREMARMEGFRGPRAFFEIVGNAAIKARPRKR